MFNYVSKVMISFFLVDELENWYFKKEKFSFASHFMIERDLGVVKVSTSLLD